jgi:uncharacterized lipoprotein YajG
MKFAKLLSIVFVVFFMSGCASDGTSADWSNIAILPNMTNIPAVHYTPDGFDTPYDYY